VGGGGAEEKGEADSLLSREPHTDLIPGLWVHDLSRRQKLNHLTN